MEELFDNAALINNIGPNAKRIFDLKTQRIWIIGGGILIIIGVVIYYNIKIEKENEKIMATKSRQGY